MASKHEMGIKGLEVDPLMLIRKSRLRMAHINLYEWNPGNGRWYPINRRNIVFSKPATVQRMFFNAMLQDKIVQVKAKYSKPKLHVLSVDLPGISTIQTSQEPFRTMQEIMTVPRRPHVQTSLNMFSEGSRAL